MKYYLIVNYKDSNESNIISLHNKNSFSLNEIKKYVYCFSSLEEFKKHLFENGLISSCDVEIDIVSRASNNELISISTLTQKKKKMVKKIVNYNDFLQCSVKPVNNPSLYKGLADAMVEVNEKIKKYSKENKSIIPANGIKGYFD